jgi:hypothetical protein
MATQRYGFGNVKTEGFIAFSERLNASPWRELDITPYDSPARRLSVPVAKITTLALSKLLIKWAIDELALAEQPSTQDADTIDRARWDPLQKQLAALISAAEKSQDPTETASASRLRGALLKGRGTQQTQLPIPQEVGYGYAQVRKARTKPLSDDVAHLKLTALIDDIYSATQALDQAVGYTVRNNQLESSRSRCVTVFNYSLTQLDLLLSLVNEEVQRGSLQALRDSLQKLVDEYPPSTEEAPASPTIPKTPIE